MKNFKIGDKLTRFPLIQGGMGVGISLGRLAGTVAKEGGIGIISTAQIGYREKDFDRNTEEANQRAILSDPSIHVSFFPGAIETTMVSSATTSWLH